MPERRELLQEIEPGTLYFGGARMALLDVEGSFWGLRRQLEALAGLRLTNAALQQAGANGGASFARAFVEEVTDATAVTALRDCVAAYQAAGFGQFTVEEATWPIGRVCVSGRNTFETWMLQQHGQRATAPVCAYSAGVLVGFINALAGRRDIVCVERTCQARGDAACQFELLPADEVEDTAVVAFDPDPFLTQQLNLLEMLFDRMPMGIAIIDPDYRLRRFNPTWANFIGSYTNTPASRVVPGVRLFELEPGTEDVVQPLLDRVLTGETVRQNGVRLESEGIVSYWDVVLMPLYEGDNVVGILDVSLDATEREAALASLRESSRTLEKRVDERTRELSMLLEVSQNVASTLELEPLLGVILDQLKAVVDYDGASILELSNDALQLLAYRGPIPAEYARQIRFPLEEAGANQAVIAAGTPIIIDDTHADAPLAQVFRATAGEQMETTFAYVRAWMGVPLVARGRTLGMLSLDHSVPGFYTQRHAELVQVFANQVAVFIDNGRLYTSTRQLADESHTLYNVQRAITSRLDPDAVLELIAEEARRLTNTEMAAVYLRDGDELVVTVVAGDVNRDVIGFRLPVADSIAGLVVTTGESFLVTDARMEQRVHRAMVDRVGAQSFIIVPLLVEDRAIGTITVANKQAGQLGADDERVLTLMASGAVVALENARLYEQEQERRQESERRRQVAESLRDILAVLNSSEPLSFKLEQIIAQAQRLLGADAAAIYRIDPDARLVHREASSGLPPSLLALRELPLASTQATQATLERRPYVEPNLPAAYGRPEYRAAQFSPELRLWIQRMAQEFHTLFSVPLVVGDELYGDITLYYHEPRTFSEDDMNLALTFGAQAALAIENVRLMQSEQVQRRAAEQRRQVAEGLSDILLVLNSNRPLDEVLDYIVSQASHLMGPATAVAIYRFDHETQLSLLEASEGLAEPLARIHSLPMTVTGPQIFFERQPLVIDHVAQWMPLADDDAPDHVHAAIAALREHYRSYLAVPLIVRDQVYGGLAFHYQQTRKLSAEDVALAQSLGEQAALAIENARLRTHSEQMAVVAERNRLARELHDAVTQTLFSASLIADVLPRIWEQDPTHGRERLAELRELTRGALAEMRTLLLELRPATLTESSLGELLKQLTDAVVGRSRLPVALQLEGQQPLPPEVQVALYRIAQESLNNITKHAGASEVTIHLRFLDDIVQMQISDNGRGFDVADVGVNSMGLGIMRERAAKIGAVLTLESEIGEGTAVTVNWPMQNAEKET